MQFTPSLLSHCLAVCLCSYHTTQCSSGSAYIWQSYQVTVPAQVVSCSLYYVVSYRLSVVGVKIINQLMVACVTAVYTLVHTVSIA